MKGLPDEELEAALAAEEAASENNQIRAMDRTSFGVMELRHRFGYHKPSNQGVMDLHQAIRIISFNTASQLDRILPEGRAKSVAITKLEEACMWANKAIAEMSPVVEE